MKVCAHYNVGPFQNDYQQFDSVAEAKREFSIILEDLGIDKGDGEHYMLDVYPQCDQCHYQANFHDYPMARYELGPRGGLRKVCI